MNNHTELLNYLIEKCGLTSYLEIGIYDVTHNFHKINAELKHGIDPDVTHADILKITSDEFFAKASFKYDLIFIDGLHHADQVKRDFENSLSCLTDNGFIVIHDTCPDAEKWTLIPRAQTRWFGDVYKFACSLNQYNGIYFCTLDIDCGCTIVKKNGKDWYHEFLADVQYKYYEKHKAELLNIIPVESLDNFIKS